MFLFAEEKKMSKKETKKEAPKAAPAKKEGRTVYIAKAPIRRLMKNEVASLVAENAVNILIEKLTNVAKDVTKGAVKIVKDDKRKRVTGADIIAASRMK
jgi:histone H3/H4